MEAPSVVPAIIDTPILIAYRKGDPDALNFLTAVRAVGMPEFSQLSAMVLIANCGDAAELSAMGWFLYAANAHQITARISRRAFGILAGLPPPCGLTADDALVAATAVEHKLPLYTPDPARFAAVPGLSALRPY